MSAVQILAMLTALATAGATGAQIGAPPHAQMQQLEFLVGDWTMDVEGIDPAGKVVHRSGGSWSTTLEMGGLVLVGAGYTEDGRLGALDWKFFHKEKGRLYDVQLDLAGNFEVRESVATEGDLAFSLTEPFIGDDGVPRDWRKTFRRTGPAAYEIETHYTEDGGKTWILGFRERYTRREAE